MKYILLSLISFFSMNVSANYLTAEEFTYQVVEIMEEHNKSHEYFLALQDKELRSVYACRSTKHAVAFVNIVYEYQEYLYLIDPVILQYMQDNLDSYKPYLTKYCKI